MHNPYISTIVFLTVFAMVFSPFAFPGSTVPAFKDFVGAKKAHAFSFGFSVTFDPSNLARMVLDFTLEAMARVFIEQLKQRILSQLATRQLDFIRNINGLPRIITDWNQELGDAFNFAFDRFIEEVGLSNLCSNIRTPTLLLLSNYRYGTGYNPICEIEDITGNIDNFINDFSQGGFIAQSTALDPYSNPLLNMLVAFDTGKKLAKEASENERSESEAAAGYKSTKRCEVPANNPTTGQPYTINYDDGNWERYCLISTITTPGKTTGDQVAGTIDSAPKYTVNMQATIAGALSSVIVGFINESLFDNIFDSLEDGLLGSASGQATSDPDDACAGLLDDAQLVCQVQQGNLADARSAALQDINESITEAQQTRAILNNLLDCQINECNQTYNFADFCTDPDSRPMSETYDRLDNINQVIDELYDARTITQNTDNRSELINAFFSARSLNTSSLLASAENDLQRCQN